MKRALSYVRVSTQKQGQNGIGLEAQQTQIDEFARLSGYRIVRRFVEVASAMGAESLRVRPELQEAILEAKRRHLPILVADLDRLSRHASTATDFILESGVVVVIASIGDRNDHVVIRSEAARAQREGELISERTKAALHERQKDGVLLGNRTNLPDAQRKGAATNQRIADLRARELDAALRDYPSFDQSTCAQIAEVLNSKGLRTPTGQNWTRDNLRRPLKRVRELRRSAERERHLVNERWGSF